MFIKQCPFCGNENLEIVFRNKEVGWMIRCDSLIGGCGANSGIKNSKEKAIEAWNSRVGTKHKIFIPIEEKTPGWRTKPITRKQINFIRKAMNVSPYPIPKFIGKNRGQASDWIEKYGYLAVEDLTSLYAG